MIVIFLNSFGSQAVVEKIMQGLHVERLLDLRVRREEKMEEKGEENGEVREKRKRGEREESGSGNIATLSVADVRSTSHDEGVS